MGKWKYDARKQIKKDFLNFIFRAQKAAQHLDMSKDFTEPIESWFWPKIIQEATDETENDLEQPKIKDITNEEQIIGS